MNDLSKQFGDLIRQERLKKKLSTMELAMAAGVSNLRIINVENGKETILFVDAMKLFRALDIPIDRLKFYVDNMPNR